MTQAQQLSRLPHLPRGRRLRHRATVRLAGWRDSALAQARRLPLPDGLRAQLAEKVLWRRDLVEVPVDRLLLGAQNQVPASTYALSLGDPGWPSRRVVDGPHAELLRRAALGPITDAEILESPYAAMARATIAAAGQYFTATDDGGVLTVTRRFLRWGAGDQVEGDNLRMPHQSRQGAPIRVTPIRHSDCYQVLDGHHRIARAAIDGQTAVPVQVRRTTVTTPLQDLVTQMSWTGGEPELYQPVESPEFNVGWRTVRRCDDRLEAMRAQLDALGIEPGGSSYLDVASCYGWFVAQFDQAGFDAGGVERDPTAPSIGALAYGLDPTHIQVSDAEEFLAQETRVWDVVSCFSLLHHFVLGRASISAEELLSQLDRVTGRVLFLDTGQSNEAWFADSLSEWNTDHVAQFLAEHTTFDRVVDLGPDRDAVGAYSRNYGRHLFAAYRE